ncbi:hypothetical protein QI052_02585 [Staphylococcus saprophyticus]|nr:hypothetical protein [Staphylococcus saprophyticus]
MIRTVKDYEKLSEQYNKMIAERNSLIDDLSWYKAKVSRLERHNKDLRIQSNTYFDEWQEAEKQRSEFVTMLNESNNLLSEISQHIGNKPSSSTYKHFRAKLDELGIKESE